MLFLMKSYQKTLNDPEGLSSTVALLEQTAELISIFCDHNRPVASLTDKRLTILNFFNSWEANVLSTRHVFQRRTL